jgi:hypothetical protein
MQHETRAQFDRLAGRLDRLLMHHHRDFPRRAALDDIGDHVQVLLVRIVVRHPQRGGHVVRADEHAVDAADIQDRIQVLVGGFGFDADDDEGFLAPVGQVFLGFRAGQGVVFNIAELLFGAFLKDIYPGKPLLTF